MNIEALTAALDLHDELLRDFAVGALSISQFVEKYDNFYWAYALDGHECLSGEAALVSLAPRIEPHRRVAEEVLAVLAPESSASQPIYQETGRIGSTEASQRLKLIAQAMHAAGA